LQNEAFTNNDFQTPPPSAGSFIEKCPAYPLAQKFAVMNIDQETVQNFVQLMEGTRSR